MNMGKKTHVETRWSPVMPGAAVMAFVLADTAVV